MKTVLKWLASAVLFAVAFLFWLAFLSPRPPLTIDPGVLAGDGSTLDYCALPVLDGSGKSAVDIAKGNPRVVATIISLCRCWPAARNPCLPVRTISGAVAWY